MPTAGSLIDQQRGIEILREIRQPILFALSRAFRNAYVAVVDVLVEQIISETSWERQDQLNASLDLLRNGKGEIEKQFEQACANNWQHRTGMGPDGSHSTPAARLLAEEPPTLRLVDDDTMHDQLQVSRISARARRRIEEELIDGMRARFGALLGQDWFAENEYPIAPDIIFEMLREIFAGHTGTGNSRIAIFLLDVFETKLTLELIEVYSEINHRLIDLGVLPELRYSIAKSKATALINSASQAAAEANATQGQAQGHGQGQGTQAGGYGQGGSALPVSDAEISGWADRMAGAGTQEPDAEVLAQATRYLADPRNFGNDGVVAAHRQATSDQLMAVLNELQNRTQEANDIEEVGTLIQEVRQQSSVAAQAHGSPLDRLIIETVAQVFQHVYEDDAIANAIKQQLLRLQVAAFKAALIDPSFFARPDHPMRRFVDRLAEIGSDPDFETEPGSPLVKDTEALVSWVLENFERELVVIGEALDRAEKMVAEETARRDERLEKIAEAASRAERIDTLRNEIRHGMNEKIGRMQVPEAISAFAVNHWVEVIVRVRDGSTEEMPFDETRAQRTLDQLLWSVQPKKAADIRELAKSVPQLIADLSRGMSFIAMPATERENFLRELMSCHGQVIEAAKNRQNEQPGSSATQPAGAQLGQGAHAQAGIGGTKPAAAQSAGGLLGRLPTPGRAAAGADTAAPENSRKDGWNPDDDMAWDAVSQSGLSHGDEIERIIDADPEQGTAAEHKHYKLGWVSPTRGVFIFSRYPTEHWTVNRKDLNRLMRQQRVKVLKKTARLSAVIESMSQAPQAGR